MSLWASVRGFFCSLWPFCNFVRAKALPPAPVAEEALEVWFDRVEREAEERSAPKKSASSPHETPRGTEAGLPAVALRIQRGKIERAWENLRYQERYVFALVEGGNPGCLIHVETLSSYCTALETLIDVFKGWKRSASDPRWLELLELEVLDHNYRNASYVLLQIQNMRRQKEARYAAKALCEVLKRMSEGS